MSVEFLSDEEAAAYGRFTSDLSRVELERFFFLDDVDRALIGKRRGAHNQLGFGLQLLTVRYLGTFLSDPLDVPWSLVDYLAEQLGVEDASVVKRYAERLPTQHEHAREIRVERGWRDFSGAEPQARVFLESRAWTHAEGPRRLFDQAVAWLRRHQVLLPAAATLARLVVNVRAAAAERMHAALAAAAAEVDSGLPLRLKDLLEPAAGRRFSELERLRRAGRRTSGRALSTALDRVSDVLAVGAGAVRVEGLPTNRLRMLARYGLSAKAPVIAQLAEPRKTATLVAAVHSLEAAAIDDALDVFDRLMQARLVAAAKRAASAARAAAMPKLEAASATLANTARVLLRVLESAEDGRVDVAACWAAVEQVAPIESVAEAMTVVETLVPDDDDSAAAVLRQTLTSKYTVVRQFLALLAESLPFQATAAGKPLLRQVRRLPELSRRRVTRRPMEAGEIDATIVPAAWRRAVFRNPDLPDGAIDRDAYVVCILEELHAALRRRDIFAAPSIRWADPRAKLLDGPEWRAVRDRVLDGLGLNLPVEAILAAETTALDAAWRDMATRLAEAGGDASVRLVPLEDSEGRAKLSVSRLDAVAEPPSLVWLRGTVKAMLPHVDLPELLLEVHSWTGFLDTYTHVGHRDSSLEDLAVTLAALLVADGCNVGLVPVTHPGSPALTRDRLLHVDQYYVRGDTHAAANARLIDAQARISLAQLWGGGMVASVDGMRFVVPIATVNAAPNPKYFGRKAGVTWINAINDQIAGIGAVVVPGTMRDSLHILDTMLNLDAGPKPDMVATDTASYSDIVFGLFKLLGYRFSPRIADIGDQRFWRSGDADYGPLNALARHKINTARIRTHWEDMLRVAGSLVDGRVRAYDLLRMLGRDGKPTPLGAALAEYGRFGKTQHLLALADPVDETYRRGIGRQLNMTESRHRLGRKIFHGQRGEMRQPYREGQEDQLGALGLVLNAVVLWNTRYMNAAVDQLRADGHEVADADAARLSPLGHEHINMAGRYHFTTGDHTTLRPLRDPDAATE